MRTVVRPVSHRATRLGIFAAMIALAAAVPAGAAPDTTRVSLPRDGQSTTNCSDRAAEAPRQLRGMWLTTVNNIDWPSRPGLDADTVKAEYRGWLDLAQRLHHNAVFVQVRPSGDAFWPSRFAPWSQWLTGRRDGRSPGWDPLEFAVAEAHARNLEFHAWFNPYRGSQPAPQGPGTDVSQLAPDHPLRLHPEWALAYPTDRAGARLYFDPGLPEARRFVEDAMLDAVARYDIDGVHFDDFFYPYPAAGQDFPDAASFARYGGGFASRADWRRHNVNTLVREMSERIKALKPWVKFGISPFGIWRNSTTDPAGSPTRGLQSYDAIDADTRLWVSRQWLDYVVPQLYWAIGYETADYAKLLRWWSEVVAGTRVQLYIGQADYRVGQPGPWQDPAELDRQLALNGLHAVRGSVHFSARDLRRDVLGSVSRYSRAHYGSPALIPQMPHLPGAAPAAPTVTAGRRDAAGAARLTWRVGQGPGAPTTAFAIYRADAGGARLVATSRRTGDADQTWTDPAAASGRPPVYCVSALDRLWNESAMSAARQVR
jgi:uncharacterized lipoprotein YddW (UPF0748 family)